MSEPVAGPDPARGMQIAERLREVRDRIDAAGGDAVRLIAVAKTFPYEDVVEAARAGQVDIGESYAQELIAKGASYLADGGRAHLGARALSEVPDQPGAEHPEPYVRWHFIGGLQRNKVRKLAGLVTLWHSVDRVELVDEIAKRDEGAAILVQVNTAGAVQQGGCAPDDIDALVERAAERGLDVRGLMTIGPQGDAATIAGAFATLRHHVDRLGLPECSMGMSGDLEIAVENGATMVRVGRDIFGERPRI